MKKIVAIIQARIGSTRLPGKVLMNVCDKPLLWHLVKRLEHSKEISEIVIATTIEERDNCIFQFCKQEGFFCFRGSEQDVLDRFYQASIYYKADYVVRITADCSITDPVIVDKAISLCREENADYVSNTNPPTFPDGLDVEVFTFGALETSWKEAKHKYQREHVTSFITEHPRNFKIVNFNYKRDLSGWRLTLDEPEDLEVISNIYEKLYKPGQIFNFEETVLYLEKNRNILNLNSKFVRNENYNINNK